MNKQLTILGIMSGTSLDGVDFALCSFRKEDDQYSYKILKTGFEAYPEHIRMELVQAAHDSGFNLIRKHKRYGRIIGDLAKNFTKDTIRPDFIASHGHTVFHKPEMNLTFQLGDAASIAAESACSVIADFRNLDTALKGQGAPLVPIGDRYLFSDYEFCLNLGGFSNISYDVDKERIAYDICPVNIILNMLAKETGAEFDKNGEIGKSGHINDHLLKKLNSLSYYSQNPPKSLGREYVEDFFIPLLNAFKIPPENKLRTYYQHIAIQTAQCISHFPAGKILVTGGGAHNSFLISTIRSHTKHEVLLPEKQIIDFKEAIIFAFLGFLRIRKDINTLKSVTGAKFNSSGGSVFIYPKANQK